MDMYGNWMVLLNNYIDTDTTRYVSNLNAANFAAGSASATFAGVTAAVAFYKDDSVTQNKGTSASLATTLPTKTEVAAIVTRDETTTTTAHAWSVVAKHPIGRFDVKAGYSHKDLGGVNAYAVGAGYNFSKRTSVELIQTVANANATADNVRITALGVNHRF